MQLNISVYIVTVFLPSCREQKLTWGVAERGTEQWKRRCSSWRRFTTCVCTICTRCSIITGCETMWLNQDNFISSVKSPVILMNISDAFVSQAFFTDCKYHLIMNFGFILLLVNLPRLCVWLPVYTHNIPNYHCLIFTAETVRKLQHVIIISTLLL